MSRQTTRVQSTRARGGASFGRIRIPIAGLACSAGDGPALERALSRLPGVTQAYVNCVTDTAYLDVQADTFLPAEAARLLEAFGARDIRGRGGPELCLEAG